MILSVQSSILCSFFSFTNALKVWETWVRYFYVLFVQHVLVVLFCFCLFLSWQYCVFDSELHAVHYYQNPAVHRWYRGPIALPILVIASGVLLAPRPLMASLNSLFRCSMCRSAGMFLPGRPQVLIKRLHSSCVTCWGEYTKISSNCAS